MPRTGLEPARYKHTHLKRARLPIPPPGHLKNYLLCLFRMLSGKRDSDPRPRPWQGRALPTELFPHYPNARSISLNAVAKVMFFFDITNFLKVFLMYMSLKN